MNEQRDNLAAAIGRLDEVTRRLRVECPWDREQDERSIVPHTIEEAFELAEAARTGDDAAMRDELGDVLFQVVFLALLLEERGEGDLALIAGQLCDKLIRRHPHVYAPPDSEERSGTGPADEPGHGPGTEERQRPVEEEGEKPGGRERPVETAGDVRRQWDRIKQDVEGRTTESDWRKPGLPALVYASKVQWKLDPSERPANAGRDNPDRDAEEERIGQILWAAVAEARRAGVDPELALRAESERRAPGRGDPQ
ncbi:MAG: nucleoside triphosphate pyrophosphohydrolase [Solirubrobacterales bacterium]|nr:nucleoside triphosphate pyrophosphohydrolase [Solirubrobacterales bacterium]